MEHLRNPDHILKQISAFLKPDGMLVMTPPTPFGGANPHCCSKNWFLIQGNCRPISKVLKYGTNFRANKRV